MKVIDLIKKLEELPQEATIGTFEAQDGSIEDYVWIYSKDDTYNGLTREVAIKEIEEFRYSNRDKKCDYYIGY